MQNVQNLDNAFTQMLLLWLRQRYNVEKYGYPTWRRLVQAIKEINPALARTIASNHAIVTGVYSSQYRIAEIFLEIIVYSSIML